MNVEKTAVKMLRNIDFKMPGCCKNCKINSIVRLQVLIAPIALNTGPLPYTSPEALFHLNTK